MPVPRQLKLWLIGLFAAVEASVVGLLLGLFASGGKLDRTVWTVMGGVTAYGVAKYFQSSPLSKVLEEIVTETTIKKTEVSGEAVVETTVKKTEVVPADTPRP